MKSIRNAVGTTFAAVALALAPGAATAESARQACEDDLHKYCAGAAQGTAKECLKANFRELSRPCKRELFEAKKGM